MTARLAADAVLTLHALFVLFVVAGGLLVLWRPVFAWAHVPAAAWGIAIELFGWLCPLTTLENRLRHAAGEAGYDGGFVEHYVVPVLYPPGLTRGLQFWLAGGVLAANLLVYGLVLYRRRR